LSFLKSARQFATHLLIDMDELLEELELTGLSKGVWLVDVISDLQTLEQVDDLLCTLLRYLVLVSSRAQRPDQISQVLMQCSIARNVRLLLDAFG